jgi:hypothetical protein
MEVPVFLIIQIFDVFAQWVLLEHVVNGVRGKYLSEEYKRTI